MKNFSQRLVEYRAKNNFTQNQIAEIFGVSRLTVINWESGLHTPKQMYYVKLSQLEKGE